MAAIGILGQRESALRQFPPQRVPHRHHVVVATPRGGDLGLRVGWKSAGSCAALNEASTQFSTAARSASLNCDCAAPGTRIRYSRPAGKRVKWPTESRKSGMPWRVLPRPSTRWQPAHCST